MMFSESSKQLMKITAIQFFITATLARVLPQTDLQYQTGHQPDSRFGAGPILTPVKFLSISKLKNKQMLYEAERSRVQEIQNGANNGASQPEYLEPLRPAPKQIRIQLARGSNKRVSITHGSGRRIHLTLRGRQDTTQTGPRQVRVMYSKRPQHVAMDMSPNSRNINDFSSGTHNEQRQRPSTKIVVLRNNMPNLGQKRVIIRTGSGTGSSPRRPVRIHFVRNNNGNNDRRNDIVFQRGATRGEVNNQARNIDHFPQVNRINNGGNAVTTSGSTQDQINSQVLAEIKGKIESLLLGQLEGQLQEQLLGQLQNELQGNSQGQATSAQIPVELIDVEEPEVTSLQNGNKSQVKPTVSPAVNEQSTAMSVDAEAEEI